MRPAQVATATHAGNRLVMVLGYVAAALPVVVGASCGPVQPVSVEDSPTTTVPTLKVFVRQEDDLTPYGVRASTSRKSCMRS
jgi:hypothetical protein